MTLKELNYFYLLSENSHISKLAKELNISQSAISLAIKSLEMDLEEELFDRIGKKLVLNERGRVFKENTIQHYNSLFSYKNSFKTKSLSGEINIAVSKTINNYILPQIIYEYKKIYPNVKINKIVSNSSNIINYILDSKVDIGFNESIFNHSYIEKTKLCDDELIIVSSNKELGSKTRYIDTLFQKDWILREPGSGTREVFLEKIQSIKSIDKKINIALESSQFEEILTLIKNNKNTLTCISKAIVNNDLLKKNLYKINIHNLEFKRQFNILIHKDKNKSKLLKNFENFCLERTLN